MLWRQLADEAGEEFVSNTGAIDYGPARMQEKMYEILTGFGVPAELIPAAAAAERWPGLSFGPDPVMFHPDGGVIDPERAMAAMRAIATARGAQVCYGTPVLRVEADGEGAAVHTADRSWRAPVVVVAAGAWLEPLLGGQVPLPPLVVTQEEAFHFAQRPPAGAWPAFIYYGDGVMYGLPAGGDGEVPGAIKIGAHHGGGGPTTGDGRDGLVRPEARERAIGFVRDWLPGLDPAPAGEVTCLYTSTVNEDFILDRHGPFVRLLALLGPRRQVRAADRGDRRRPGLRWHVARAPLHPGGPPRLSAAPGRVRRRAWPRRRGPGVSPGPGRPLVRRRRRTAGSGELRSEPKWLPIC